MLGIAGPVGFLLLAGALAATAPAEAQPVKAPAGLAAALEILPGVASRHGLDPADYDTAPVLGRLRAGGPDADGARAEAEGLLRRFLADLQGARVAPGDRGVLVDAPPLPPEIEGPLEAVARGEDLGRVAATLEPRFPAYARLAASLARWRARASLPEPPDVPVAPKVKSPKDLDLEGWEGAAALRTRLDASGEPAADRSLPLGERLRRYQERHGLQADGVPGLRTAASLNVPASRRVRQIELAMERLRWFPAPERRLVYVEVPRAMLWAFEAGEPVLSMRLVVGEAPDHDTPMMASRITGVVFRPFWVPPPNILREEVLPKARARPGWLAANQMEIVAGPEEDAPALEPSEANLEAVALGRLTLRQRPGPRNSLGLVKFVVPNPACIGLHGTPFQRLFERPRRDRSHGCIRLEQPMALAGWVLGGQEGWDEARALAAAGLDHSSQVRLREPVDVAVVYATASVDPDGSEVFLEDIYGLDRKLDEMLAVRATASRADASTPAAPPPR